MTSFSLFTIVLAAGIAALTCSSQASASDTIAHLALDDGSGTIASDSSGNGANGTLLGDAAFAAVSGDGSSHSVRFDGNNDIIDLGPLDIQGDELSLAAWFNADQFPGTNRDPRIISKANGLSGHSHVFMLSTTKSSGNTRLRGRVRVGGVTTTVTALSGDLDTNTWYHAALTYDGAVVRLYLNGVQVGNKSRSGTVDTAPSINVAVGGQPDQINRIWDGYIDDVRILQRALTATEITDIAAGNDTTLSANNDSYSTDNATTLSVAATGVLANDSGSSLTVIPVSTTTNGTLLLNTDGSFDYQPNTNFTGNDSFTYQATDGQSISNTATVNITVTGDSGASQLIYVSTIANGTVSNSSGDTISYRDEDIIRFNTNTSEWSMFFDGSDVGITGDVNAFTLLQDNSLLISLTSATNIAGLGIVDDSDIIKFIPTTTGATTSGAFELYFDGSDVGLSTNAEDIHALTLLDNGNIIVSTSGNVNVTGLSASDSDLIAFEPTQLGSNTSGSWSLYFQGTDVELTTSGEDIWATSIDADNIYLSTYANFSTTAVAGSSADFLLCQATSIGADTACNYSLFWIGGDNGLAGQFIDAMEIDIPGPIPTNNPPVAVNDSYTTTQDTQLIVAASGVLNNDTDADNDPISAVLVTAASNGTVTLDAVGSLIYTPDTGYSGLDSFTYRADDGQATSNAATVSIVVTENNIISNPIYVSTTSSGTVGNISYYDEDILVFDTDANQWSLYFDGSDVGITRNINAFTVVNDGSLLLSLIATTTVPGIGSVRDSDIIRFIPTSTGNTTSGTFELYFDGSDVGLSTSSEDIQAIELLSNGNIIISTTGSASVPGVSADDSDLLLFSPTQLGDTTAGTWSRYFDGSDVSLTTGGEDIWGVSIEGNNIFISTYTNFNVNSTSGAITGDSADVILCASISTGNDTACSYSLFWNGGTNGLNGKVIDGIDIGASPPEGGPVIDVWYGPTQSFGQIGQPQNYINILGNTTDPDGVAALTYQLNGANPQAMSIGSDSKRLWSEGDFNADIAISTLQNGVNQVVLTATDTLGNVQSDTVNINYDNSTSWPDSYQIDWSQQTSIQNTAQIVDGDWTLTPDGPRTDEQAYDRLLAIGDIGWTDYEILVEATIHSINTDPALYPGVGLILRWTGHTDDPLSGFQPKSGWRPFGAVGWMAYFPPTTSPRMQITGYQTPNQRKNFSYVFGQPYKMRYRVETVSASESTYSMKVWNAADSEPGNWDLVYNDVTSSVQAGSALLIANHADVTFGDVSITPISSGQRLAAKALTVNSTDNSNNTRLAGKQTSTPGHSTRPEAESAVFSSYVADGSEEFNTGATDTWLTTNDQITDTNQWWDFSWPYRATIEVNSGDFDRTDLIIEIFTNLTSLFGVNSKQSIDTDTIRCHEVDSAGALVALDIPCQFDPDTSGVAGTLILMASSDTPAGTQRFFHTYFSQHGGDSISKLSSDLVTTEDFVTDEGRSSIKINTTSGSYFYLKNAGAFSSLVDIDGNDWIGYQNDSTAQAEQLRGLPNLAAAEGYLHPMATNAETSMISQGPLKTTLESTTNDKRWKTRWEFYPDHAALTVLAANSSFQYTYEGTPDGIGNLNSGTFGRANGSTESLLSNWTEDLIGEEWVYLTRGTRSLVMLKEEDDTVAESYTGLYNKAARFQFGPETPKSGGIGSYVWSKYLFGLRETGNFKEIQQWVDSIVEPVNVTIRDSAVAR